MIIKMVAAGKDHFKELYSKNDNEYLIGIDGGLKAINELGLKANLAVGDFDSFSISEINADSIIEYTTEKDYSDLELGLKEALKLEHKKIEMYNVTGGRLDHFINVIYLLINNSNYNIEIINKYNNISIKKGNFKVAKEDYKYISFFPVYPFTVITLEKFKYPLNDYVLKEYDSLCLSNEILGDYGYVEVNKEILVVKSNPK